MKELPSHHLAVGGKELLVDPWTQRLRIRWGAGLVDHVVHVVEHVEVGILPEMIRWPFSWVPARCCVFFFRHGESCLPD